MRRTNQSKNEKTETKFSEVIDLINVQLKAKEKKRQYTLMDAVYHAKRKDAKARALRLMDKHRPETYYCRKCWDGRVWSNSTGNENELKETLWKKRRYIDKPCDYHAGKGRLEQYEDASPDGGMPL